MKKGDKVVLVRGPLLKVGTKGVITKIGPKFATVLFTIEYTGRPLFQQELISNLGDLALESVYNSSLAKIMREE